MSAERVRPPRAAELAWIGAPLCALVVAGAIVWLGPVVGHALPGPGADVLWPREAPYVAGQPEPVKHGRYLLALAGPALLAAMVLVFPRVRTRLQPRTLRALVRGSQTALAAFLVLTVLGQRNLILHDGYHLWPVFSVRKLAVAAGLAVAAMLAMRHPSVARLAARAGRETRSRRVACVLIAGGITAAWLLSAVDTDRSAGDAGALFWPMDDAFAVLSGRTPLLNYHPMYAQLVPYLSATLLRVLGADSLRFTAGMATLSLLALLGAYATLRRVARSSLWGLMLYLPMLAAGFLLVHLPGGGIVSNVSLFSMWPMRYGGAYLLAWLTARHLDGVAPRRLVAVWFVGGLVAIDDVEFGVPALAATLVAVLCTRQRWSPHALARLAGGVAIGMLTAALAVVVLVLVRTGALPHPGILLEYSRIFGAAGALGAPMPAIGIHLAVYVGFAAAIAVAVVRRASGEEDTLLTGMLAWSGVFGLLAGAYFVGRSDMLKLVSLFSAWFFALALIAVDVIRRLQASRWRRIGAAELAVLLALALGLCSFNELPRPWSQIARLRETHRSVAYETAAKRLVARFSSPGERVAVLIQGGHRIAYDAGVTNVAPYSFIEAMLVKSQMTTLIRTVRREGAHKLFVPTDLLVPQQAALLANAGFSPQLGNRTFSIWSDRPLPLPGVRRR